VKEKCNEANNYCGITTIVTQAGKDEGKTQCLTDIAAWGIFDNPELLTTTTATPVKEKCNEANNYCGITIVTKEGKEAGKKDCLKDPAACGIFAEPTFTTTTLSQIATPVNANCNEANNYCGITIVTKEGKEAGKNECLTNPTACGAFSEPYFITTVEQILTDVNNTDNCNKANNYCGITIVTKEGKEAGKNECIKDPTVCGIFTDVTDATQTAIKGYCSADPSSCFNIAIVPESIEETYCDNKTKNCFSEENGLYLSTVYNENDPNTPFAKDVQMDFFEGGLFAVRNFSLIDPLTLKLLKVKVDGDGTGKVISYPMGIICDGKSAEGSDSDCEENYDETTSVELYAVPKDKNSVFDKWSGDCEGQTNHLSLAMGDKKDCTATFVKKVDSPPPTEESTTEFTTLSIIVVSGEGSVTANERDCSSSPCRFDKNTKVTLTAAPDSPPEATVTWGGNCEDISSDSDTVVMDKDKACTVTFEPKFQLTVVKNEKAQINITSDDGDDETVEINCGDVCDAYYASDTEITLSVDVTEGVIWDKCDQAITDTADYVEYSDSDPVTMTEDKTCTFSVE
jgi:hypothetical protein